MFGPCARSGAGPFPDDRIRREENGGRENQRHEGRQDEHGGRNTRPRGHPGACRHGRDAQTQSGCQGGGGCDGTRGDGAVRTPHAGIVDPGPNGGRQRADLAAPGPFLVPCEKRGNGGVGAHLRAQFRLWLAPAWPCPGLRAARQAHPQGGRDHQIKGTGHRAQRSGRAAPGKGRTLLPHPSRRP